MSGVADYSWESLNELNLDAEDLINIFTAEEQLGVASKDAIGVDCFGEGTNSYATFLFKKIVNSSKGFKIAWTGQSTQSCVISPIYLQVLNRVSGLWETIASDMTTPENVSTTLKGIVFLKVSAYRSETNEVACRVYQKIK